MLEWRKPCEKTECHLKTLAHAKTEEGRTDIPPLPSSLAFLEIFYKKNIEKNV